MSRKHTLRRFDLGRRLLAAGCAALVFALGLFAASPTLHARLHHDGHLPSNDGCVVCVFAGGVSLPLDMPRITPPATEWQDVPLIAANETLPVSPRYRLQPSHGPPSA